MDMSFNVGKLSITEKWIFSKALCSVKRHKKLHITMQFHFHVMRNGSQLGGLGPGMQARSDYEGTKGNLGNRSGEVATTPLYIVTKIPWLKMY